MSDIDNSHRLRPRDPSSTRPPTIIMKFVSSRVLRRVFDARFKLKHVNEQRTAAARIAAAGGDAAASEDDGASGDEDDASDDESHDESGNEADGEDEAARLRAKAARAKKWQCAGDPLWISEDLSKMRSDIAFEARKLKRREKIKDTWTHDMIVKIKTLPGVVRNIESMPDLDEYR